VAPGVVKVANVYILSSYTVKLILEEIMRSLFTTELIVPAELASPSHAQAHCRSSSPLEGASSFAGFEGWEGFATGVGRNAAASADRFCHSFPIQRPDENC
jgi:hypothetical protein